MCAAIPLPQNLLKNPQAFSLPGNGLWIFVLFFAVCRNSCENRRYFTLDLPAARLRRCPAQKGVRMVWSGYWTVGSIK